MQSLKNVCHVRRWRLGLEAAHAMLYYRSVTSHIFWFPWLVFDNGRNISMAWIRMVQMLKSAVMFGCGSSISILRVALADCNRDAHVIGHLLPTVRASQRVVHLQFLLMSSNWGKVSQVLNSRSERECCYDLCLLVDYGLLIKRSSLVNMELGSGMVNVERCCLAVTLKRLFSYQFLQWLKSGNWTSLLPNYQSDVVTFSVNAKYAGMVVLHIDCE